MGINKPKYIFTDLEFTGLHQESTIISIAMIDENNNGIYITLNDYDRSQVDEWLQDNVINNLHISAETFGSIDKYYNVPRSFARAIVMSFIHNTVDTGEIGVFVSDVMHYDLVLLIDLLSDDGTALKLSSKIAAAGLDINHLIADKLNLNVYEAFNKGREDLLASLTSEKFSPFGNENKHNALHDTYIIKGLYDTLTKIK